MVEHLDHTIVSVKIPHPHDPERHLRDKNGHYPTMIHERTHGTFEDTVRKIGQGVAGIAYLSVEVRLKGASNKHILYAAKTPDATHVNLPQDSEFTWRSLQG